MGKAKKGKKDAAGEGVDENVSDNDVPQTDITEVEVENRKNDKKSEKEKRAKKLAVDSDDGEEDEVTKVTESVKKMAVTKKKDKQPSAETEPTTRDDSDGEKACKNKDAKKKKSAKSGPVGFSLLMMDDDDDVDDAEEEPTNQDEEREEMLRKSSVEEEAAPKESGKGKKATQNKKDSGSKLDEEDGVAKGGKKSKKKKKKDEDDDDEIDRMLAELGMEYSGQKPPPSVEEASTTQDAQQSEKQSKKKDKKKKKDETNVDANVDQQPEAAEEEAKTAPEKKKGKQNVPAKEEPVAEPAEAAGNEEPKKKGKNKGKKNDTAATVQVEEATAAPKKGEPAKKSEAADTQSAEASAESKKKKPNKAALAIMQERLKAIREEEERLRKEEEEKQKLEEQAEQFRLEQLRLEQEKKEKKKQKEKERKERLKAEGKLLTAKQKQNRARAQAMLEALKAQGIGIPESTGERRAKPGSRIRPKKNQDANKEVTESKESTPTADEVKATEEKKVKEKEVKESWDATDSEEEEQEEEVKPVDGKSGAELSQQQSVESKDSRGTDDEDDDEEGEDDSGDDNDDDKGSDDGESSGSEVGDHRREAEKMRQRALDRIANRTQEAEKKRTLEHLRAAVVCVLGHVDTGKTKILDKLRRTNVQDGEAGGITQQIGATNVPAENIKEQTKFVKGFQELEFKLPGLLIIDTPGHESFSNLRSRGSSLCDIAILVVDIMHGLEPQTIESINLLKSKRTPFVVALNKIDRLYDWSTMPRKDVRDILKSQASNTQLEFNQRTKEIIVQFAEQGLNAALFYENPDPKTYVSLVPTSAITGEGMGNLLFLIVQFCQKQLAKRLMYSEDLQATVLEVKAIPGLGTTIDAILINGKLREGDTMILAGTEGPIVTQIKALLMPQPMKELRVKNAYVEHKEILAAQGVKIAAKELEKAIAGLNLQIAHKPDEVEIFKDIVARDLKSALNSIKLSDRGVYVQASTLGSLEALLEFLRTSKIPYSGIRIGPVVKRDVMKASTMLEHENQYATILAFDVKVERDAQDLADHLGVKVFQADIIYHLFDKFMAYRDEIKQRKRDEFKSIAVFPCKLKILPQFVFNSRDPIVVGVIVEAGIVKEGTPITVPSKEFTDLGVVTSIEANHKQIESARKGQEVCIKIEPIPGETPKLYGRHFDETDMLVSKISRQSIDACKDYFRDDLLKSDWTLMVELKKTFQIL
ncbi:eukaryotic translation initiation factor 5B [Anopheles maculipalpis]|uniref:eukaryotic translation initiation factor 5B n=1 Tax=Anopheles maculipalpis TaxID=1496333 RepID=UPI00215924E2|nr:eukaryotic translation initiation factor 5B [Anopheles maculipalpis]